LELGKYFSVRENLLEMEADEEKAPEAVKSL
jgi:hypothetical protein